MRIEGEIQPIEILLVEDNPGDVRLTREALKGSKVYNNLQVISDGEEAIKYLKREGQYSSAPRPDLVLLDLNLPGRDGREILSEIKTSPELNTIPVVILTTSSAEQDIQKTYSLHANCYITKPLELEGFTEVVRSVEGFWLSIVKLPSRAAHA